MDGIDYGGENDQEVTWYAPESRFLNGGFESKGRYWINNFSGHDVRTCIVNDAHTGKYALQIRGMDFVQSMSLAIKPGRYTVSWWSKLPKGMKSAGSGVSLWSWNGLRDPHGKPYGGGRTDKKLTDEWQRFSYTFDWKMTGISIRLDGKALIDDVQIEEGTRATAYAGNPFGLELLHDQSTGPYADSKEPINLKLRITGPAGAEGTVRVKVTDFMTRDLGDTTTTFALGGNGGQIIPLGEDSGVPFGTTTFAVTVTSDKIVFTDYLRFTKIDARDGKDRLRGLQGTHIFGFSKPDVKKPGYIYDRLRDFGIGTLAYSGNQGMKYERLTQADVEHLDAHGIRDRWGGILWDVNWKQTLNGKPWMWEGQSVLSLTNYPPAFLEWVENETHEMARAIPWTTYFAFHTEPSAQYETLRRRDSRSYAKLMLAVNRGLMRANPDIIFIPYGMWNMVPHWRPSIDLYAWSGVGGKDGYSHVGLPTYDVGWGERIGAALILRETIVYFKYQDKVNANCSWCPQVIDQRTPVGWTAVNAALMSILGNATFVEDIRFAKDCRAYVFDDAKGNTVALVWRGDNRFDRGLSNPVEMSLTGSGGWDVLDMCGNECAAHGALPLSGFPFYLKAANKNRGKLTAAIRNARVSRDETLTALLPPERKLTATYCDNSKPDWTSVPVQNDEKIEWQIAWKEEMLWFRATADARRSHGPIVDLYFDGFGNAREHFLDGETGYDYDDFVYRLRTFDDNGAAGDAAECFRVRAPDHQLTGGAGYGFVKDVVETNVTVTATVAREDSMKTVFEAAFPLRYLMPIKLGKGLKIGFSAELKPYASYENRPHLFRTLELQSPRQ